MVGAMRCPDRANSPFQEGTRSPFPDRWRKNEWGWGPWRRLKYWMHSGPKAQAFNDWLQSGWRGRWRRFRLLPTHWSLGGTKWDWPWQPRTCSYCGSAHPDDVLQLLLEGWEHEKASGKNYKGYLNPPGAREYRVKLDTMLEKRNQVMVGQAVWEQPPEVVVPKFSSPVPMVKFYIWHFDDAMIDQLNAAIKGKGRLS